MIWVVARGFMRCACCLPECLNGVTWMFLWSAKVLTCCYKDVSRVFWVVVRVFIS